MPEDRPRPEPLPEQIFKCAACSKDIIAYGTRGESFITKYDKAGNPTHWHNNGVCFKG